MFPFLQNFCLVVQTTVEPKTYEEASQLECWQRAMNAEVQALEENNTWKIVDLPNGKHPIGCRWVYKVKYHADGTIERYKARLVAKGYTQMEGVDYFDTFSPMAKLTTVRVLLALASAKGWFLEQLDVNNAFLHGDLYEEVYMELPPGFTSAKPNQVCQLQKSLYGLKQASRQWYSKLSSALISLHYSQSAADHSLFIKTEGASFTALLVYVDDIVLAGNNFDEIKYVKAFLDQQFKIKDLGPLRYFLGLEISRSKSGLLLNQRKYTLEILSDSGFLGTKSASTPMDASTRLQKDAGAPFSDASSYRRLVGRLLYLTTTRPDICYAVQQLSQFVSQPMDIHFQAATRVLKYLKGSPSKGILFPANSTLKITGFADSDWAGCLDTRRSITGYCVFVGSSLVAWKSKKQSTVSKSSSEAEYRALAALTCELQWLSYLLHDLHLPSTEPYTIYCDNKSAVYLAHNPSFHERTKHIEIDCHIIREKIQLGLIHLLPISSAAQLADVFTKPLPPNPFHESITKLGLLDIHSPT